MITVAKSFDAPIKLIFPQDLIENGIFTANKFAMLGLGMLNRDGATIHVDCIAIYDVEIICSMLII